MRLFMKGLVAAMVGGVVVGIAASQVLNTTLVSLNEITTVAGAGAAICGLAYTVGRFHGAEYREEAEKVKEQEKGRY